MQDSYILKEINYDNQELFSVSKLKTYSTCSKYYEYQYVLGFRDYSYSFSTVLGNVIHNSLELFHLSNKEISLLDCLNKVFISTLKEVGVVNKELDEGILQHLTELNKLVQKLYYRASEHYTKSDAIRTKSGAVPKDPTKTTDWKSELINSGANQLKEDIDQYCDQHSDTLNNSFLVTDLYSECYKLLAAYQCPEEEIEVEKLEFGLSHLDKESNKVINPCFIGDTDKLLRGYIDKIGIYEVNGKRGRAIVDYKTSKTEMNSLHVSTNEQLHIYAWFYQQLTGETVDFIGIENIKFGTIHLVPIDQIQLTELVENFLFRIKLIENKMFYKEHAPDSRYSKCLDNYGKQCPFLGKCYPAVFNKMNEDTELFKLLNL